MNKGLLSVCLLTLLFTSADNVFAQESATLNTKETESSLIKRKSIVIVRKRTEKEETQGIKLDNYIFLPSFTITEYYDDNLFAQDGNEKNDWITVFTPSFNLKSDWKQHKFNAGVGLEAVRHVDFATENTDNAWINMNGQYDFSKNRRLFAGISFIRDHEDRGSADAEVGSEPTEFEDYSVNIGYSGNKNSHYFRLAIDTRRLDFDDVSSPFGTIDYDDRDRDEGAFGVRYLYKYSTTMAFFVDAVDDRRDYRQTPDNGGNDRNSDGLRYAVGIERVTPNIIGRVFVGQLTRDYQSAVFDEAEENDFGLHLRWKISPATNLIARLSRSIEETTLDNSPGYLMDNNLVRLNVALSKEKALIFDVIDSQADYFDIDRRDNYLNYGITYNQQLLSNLKLGVELHRAERNSNVTGEDYKINQIFFRIKAVI